MTNNVKDRLRQLAVTAIFSFLIAMPLLTVSETAAAFCCPKVYSVTLTPVDPQARPVLSGYVEINECQGMSFLHIVVMGNLPNGTQLVPVIPGRQPLLGDWFTVNSRRGETIWQGISQYGKPAGGLQGRTINIADQNFTSLLTATF